MTTEHIAGTRSVATRMVAAEQRFIDSVQEQFGYNAADAARILAEFRARKVIKIDAVTGQYQLKYGALWDADVMRRALALAAA